MAEIIDISVPLSPSTVSWENELAPVIERVNSIEAGDGYNLSRLAFGSHSGTHVDAPLHFIEQGGSVDQMPLDALIGPVVVIDARDVAKEIDLELVERELPPGCERVVFSTRNSELWDQPSFSDDFVGISPGRRRFWSSAAFDSWESTTSRSVRPRRTASCSRTRSSFWKVSTCAESRRVATGWSVFPFVSSAPTGLPPAPY